MNMFSDFYFVLQKEFSEYFSDNLNKTQMNYQCAVARESVAQAGTRPSPLCSLSSPNTRHFGNKLAL